MSNSPTFYLVPKKVFVSVELSTFLSKFKVQNGCIITTDKPMNYTKVGYKYGITLARIISARGGRVGLTSSLYLLIG